MPGVKNMSEQAIFQRYIQIAEVLGQMFPNLLEAVVHDFTDLDKSIIYIVNGHISGRKVGAGASELGIRRLLGKEKIPDVLVNYTNINHKGNRLKSASIAIRDQKGKMIGAFCLNFDVSSFEQIQQFLNPLIQSENFALVGKSELTAESTVEEDVGHSIQEYLKTHGMIFSQLAYSDKQSIIVFLRKNGAFKQRGAVFAAAKLLGLTRQTIYNYLKKGCDHVSDCK